MKISFGCFEVYITQKKPHHEEVRLNPSLRVINKNGGSDMFNVTITDEQKVLATLNPRTAPSPSFPNGKPAKLDGAPTWKVTDGDVTLEVSADGLSATLISGDNLGDSIVLVTADADLGTGVIEISDTIVVTVTGANAQNLGITLGAPEPK